MQGMDWNMGGASASQKSISRDLNKALTVGYPNMPGAQGSPLVAQSLDPLLVNLSFDMKDLALWSRLAKVNIKNTVAQYDELNSYGDGPLDDAFIAEVDTPEGDDAGYTRQYDVLKQMAQRGSVSFTAIEVGGIVDPLAQESKTQTMRLLRKLEHACWYGNSVVAPLQFDGFIPRILARSPAENILDLRGGQIRQEDIMQAATTVSTSPNFGTLTHLFLNNVCKGDIAAGLLPDQRNLYGQNQDNNNLTIGINPSHVLTTNGSLELVATPFLTDGGPPKLSRPAVAAKCPPAPIVTGAAVGAPASGVASQFSTNADVGTVSYVAQACNRYGASPPVFFTPGSTLATVNGQVVTATITPAPGILPEHIKIYRTPVNSAAVGVSNHRLIQQIPNCDANGNPQNGPIAFVDTNAKLPGTFDAVGFEMSPEFVRFIQLGPMMRIPAGVVETALSFFLRINGTPQLRAPGKVFLFQNVGLSKRGSVIV